MYAKANWYVDGLRWIGTVFTVAADHLERIAGVNSAPLEPNPNCFSLDDRVCDVRHRVHVHF